MTQDTCYDASGGHLMNQFAKHLSHGQKFEGEHFPLTSTSNAAVAGAR